MQKLLAICFSPVDAAPLGAFAEGLGLDIDVLLVGSELPIADGFADGLRAIASGYSHFAAVSSMTSKDIMARFAGMIDAAMVTDVTAIVSPTTFQRPIVAGTMIETTEVLSTPAVFTIRPAGFDSNSQTAASEVSGFQPSPSKATRLNVSAKSGGRPELTQANVVVSGGRPLKDAETYERIIGGLADKLGGAAGATRAAVDSGIAPNDAQVGQTGKIVAPELYIAAGISGSTQHMAGIKDSKIIVAINKDPDAPIYEFADFGLVADLYEAIPEIMSKAQS